MQKHGVEFNVLCTVHDANVDHPLEVYRFFRDEVRTQFMQFIPIVERSTTELLEIANAGWGDHNRHRPLYTQDGGLVTERTVRPEAWGAFLTGIFDEWVTHDVGNVFIQLFESALASWLGMPASLCIFAETCGNALALEHNGDLYSCDHFVEPRFRFGNIRSITCYNWSPRTSSGPSATPNATPCRSTAASATCVSLAMASARAIALSRHRTARRASTISAPDTRPSSGTSISP